MAAELRAALVALAVLLLLPAAALAHGGPRVLTSTEGPYHVAADERLLAFDEGRAVLDSTVYLTDARTGEAVTDARVRVTVAPPGRPPTTHLAHRKGNTYETLVELREPDHWRDVRFHVVVDGPLGAARFAYQAPGLGVWPWQQPLVIGGTLLALVLYLQGWVRLRRRRPDLADAGRLAAFGAGLVVLLLALLSPVDTIGERYLLSAHMLQHVMLGDLAPALLVLGLRGPLALFVLPPAILSRLARAPVLPAVARWLFRPSVALCAWALVYAAWHVPALYDAAIRHQWVHDLEHASFLLVGLLVWSQIIDPLPGRRLALSRRILVALVLFGLGTILSDVLIFSFRPLYEVYSSQPDRLLDISPMTDQRLAGLVMLLEQALTIGTALAFLLWQTRLRPRAEALGQT
jgi:cytochrome c oxidase assembly factor CtaG